ncbi:MAG TPA: hypothetical protein VK145_02625 [Candidatus Nanoarchaeia archaeon]|nr:hypothetical protein [Candidatus Nanoarchaeia archaeon]
MAQVLPSVQRIVHATLTEQDQDGTDDDDDDDEDEEAEVVE